MNENNDPRTEQDRQKMAEHFAAYESDYRGGAFSQIVYEDNDIIIASDASGHELNEWADELDVNRTELSEYFHAVARDRYNADMTGDPWAVNDPVIFNKRD